MTNEELNARLAASPSPDRITPEYLKSRIAEIEYVEPGDVSNYGTLTVCIITLDNDFQVIGKSACADPKNYDQEIGRKIAYDNAEREIWPLLGFMLREALYRRSMIPKGMDHLRTDGWTECRSHKVVHAAVIHAAEFKADGSGKVAIRTAEGGPEIVEVPAGFLREPGKLQEGDVLVRYADGYLSWSPLAKFLEGYTEA